MELEANGFKETADRRNKQRTLRQEEQNRDGKKGRIIRQDHLEAERESSLQTRPKKSKHASI